MKGKTVLITGANSGIGEATALELARRGARVLVHGRRPDAVEAARQRIAEAAGSQEVHGLLAELSSQRQLHELAAEVARRHERLDVLIHNAGVILGQRRISEDGIELSLAVNHLAPFLLTQLLMDRLRASAPSRVIVVSSEVHRRLRAGLDLEDLQCARRYRAQPAYRRSKLANILFTRELARRLEGSGVTANALHPGVARTRVGMDGDMSALSAAAFGLVARFLGSPESAAETSVHLACAPELAEVSGRYFVNCQAVQPSPAAMDDEAARRLWQISEQLTGLA